MLEKTLPAHWLEKLKSEIENPFNSTPTTQVSDSKKYRDPVSDIPDEAEPRIFDSSDGEEETLDDPMEIDFVKRKEEPYTSIATIPVKIKRLKIPAMVIDSGAEPAIISEDIVKRVGGKIDKSEIYDLSGVATVPTESIGITRNLPITFPPGFTIREDYIVVSIHVPKIDFGFLSIVVRTPKPILLFPNPHLKKYKCAMDWDKDELKIPFNGKNHIISVNMIKIKNKLEVNCTTATRDNKSSTSDQISQETDEGRDDSVPFEGWNAPAGFSLDSANLTLKKKRMSYEDIVVRTPKPILLFPNPHLKKYKCAMDWDKDELKIPFNGKNHIISVNMIKIKNKLEVNCTTATRDNKSSTSDQISQETDEGRDDSVPFEGWNAPAGFSLDSANLTLKKKRMSYEELEKSLYEVLNSKFKLIELNKKLRLHRNNPEDFYEKVVNTDIEKTKID
ncbi:hypothetical protein Glove_30g146 [Diversispora epigaea]|uniref:Uncharacterized protein n=1 Tax=Diversispora epigaea TaxID=1348612 RepID=A0A397JKJ4_9GLOM|nr:hypothetical protein Glove_30g146 [Diversispora epigaea]